MLSSMTKMTRYLHAHTAMVPKEHFLLQIVDG